MVAGVPMTLTYRTRVTLTAHRAPASMTSKTATGDSSSTICRATAAMVLQAMIRSLTPCVRRNWVISAVNAQIVSTDLTP